MTLKMAELIAALGGASALRVKTASGKLYDVSWDTLTANKDDPDPYIYGYPVVPKWHRSHGRVRWFYARNVEPTNA